MHFVIVTHKVTKGDGQGRVNYEIAVEALRQGHEITVLSSQVDASIVSLGAHFIEVPVSRLPTALFRNQIFAIRSTWELRKLAGNYDALLLNGFITWIVGDVNIAHMVHSAWLKSAMHPLCTSPNIINRYYQGLYTIVNARLEKMAFKRAKLAVAVSTKVREELLQLGMTDKQMTVILNGVDPEEFTPGNGNRKLFELSHGAVMALFAGDVKSRHKNLETVLRAMSTVPQLRLAVAGRFDGSPYLAMAKELGVSHRVDFLGFVKDMPTLMRSVDFLVFPSRYDSFGLVLLEAMASGLPVVTSRTSGASELIPDSAGIIIADPDDVSALARAMQTLTHDPMLRQRMGLAGRQVSQAYSWRRMAQQYLDALERLACERGLHKIDPQEGRLQRNRQ